MASDSKQLLIGNIKIKDDDSIKGSRGTFEKYHAEHTVFESSPRLTYSHHSDFSEVYLDGDFIAHSFRARSDKRLKENISNIDSSLDIVKKLDAKKYNFINKTKTSYGFLAQDMEKVLPELVEDDSEGLKSISYGEIIPILSNAIKELSKKIDMVQKNDKNVCLHI